MPTSKLDKFTKLGVRYKAELQQSTEILRKSVNSFKSVYANYLREQELPFSETTFF